MVIIYEENNSFLVKVRKDVATERIVGSLKVKCCQHDSGCVWEGELRGMKEHNAQCKYQQADKEEGMREELLKCREELQNCRGELNSMKEKAKEVDILKEKVTQQQRVIEDLAGKVEQLQRLLAQKENAPPTTSRSKQGESSGACANPRGAEKDKEVARKRKGGNRGPPGGKLRKCSLNLLLYLGDPKNVVIKDRYNSLTFGLGYATVLASCEPVPIRCKVWYEIECYSIGSESVNVGWSSVNNIALEQSDFYEIGDDDGSYAFHVNIYGNHSLHHNMRQVDLTEEKIRKIPAREISCVGVALDMVKGEILFSVDGIWMKNTLNNVPLDAKLVPAISSGKNASIKFNFAENEFMYTPPDSTFKSMKDILH